MRQQHVQKVKVFNGEPEDLVASLVGRFQQMTTQLGDSTHPRRRQEWSGYPCPIQLMSSPRRRAAALSSFSLPRQARVGMYRVITPQNRTYLPTYLSRQYHSLIGTF